MLRNRAATGTIRGLVVPNKEHLKRFRMHPAQSAGKMFEGCSGCSHRWSNFCHSAGAVYRAELWWRTPFHSSLGRGALLDSLWLIYRSSTPTLWVSPAYQGYGLRKLPLPWSRRMCRPDIPLEAADIGCPIELKICDNEGMNCLWLARRAKSLSDDGECQGPDTVEENPVHSRNHPSNGWSSIHFYTGDLGIWGTDGFLYVCLSKGDALRVYSSAVMARNIVPKGSEEALVEKSSCIDQLMLHNNQNAFTRFTRWHWWFLNKERPEDKAICPDAPGFIVRQRERGCDTDNTGADKPVQNWGYMIPCTPDRFFQPLCHFAGAVLPSRIRMINSNDEDGGGKIEKAYAERIEFLYCRSGRTVNPVNKG